MSGMLNGMFAHLGDGMCRLSLNGNLAVKTSNGYKTYDVDTGRLTNVSQFCFDIGQELFFVVPTTKARRGDILLIDNRPKCVIENKSNNTLKVMDYESSAIQEIVPERHIFMGQVYFYRKIVSMFGSGKFLKGEKGINKMMKLMMLREMFKSGGFGNNDGSMGGLMGAMMMSQMFGGNSGADFSEMFDLDFDSSDEEVVEAEEVADTENK